MDLALEHQNGSLALSDLGLLRLTLDRTEIRQSRLEASNLGVLRRDLALEFFYALITRVLMSGRYISDHCRVAFYTPNAQGSGVPPAVHNRRRPPSSVRGSRSRVTPRATDLDGPVIRDEGTPLPGSHRRRGSRVRRGIHGERVLEEQPFLGGCLYIAPVAAAQIMVGLAAASS